MTASFAALSTDHVDTNGKAFSNVFRVADHVHVKDAGFMEALDDMGGGHADGGDE